MVGKIEARIRELDDTKYSIAQIAYALNILFQFKKSTVFRALMAKRNGFVSVKEYDQCKPSVKDEEVTLMGLPKRQSDFEGEQRNLGMLVNAVEYSDSSLQKIEKERAREILSEYIKTLPKTERYVITQYFYEGRTLENIGKELGRTKERIRQLRNKAVSGLRRRCRTLLESA